MRSATADSVLRSSHFSTHNSATLLAAPAEKDFIDAYSSTHDNVRSKRRIRYLELDDPYARPAGSLEIDPSLLEIGGPESGGTWLEGAFED